MARFKALTFSFVPSWLDSGQQVSIESTRLGTGNGFRCVKLKKQRETEAETETETETERERKRETEMHLCMCQIMNLGNGVNVSIPNPVLINECSNQRRDDLLITRPA